MATFDLSKLYNPQASNALSKIKPVGTNPLSSIKPVGSSNPFGLGALPGVSSLGSFFSSILGGSKPATPAPVVNTATQGMSNMYTGQITPSAASTFTPPTVTPQIKAVSTPLTPTAPVVTTPTTPVVPQVTSNATMTTPTTPQTPQTPVVPSAAEAAVTSAQKTYEDSLKLSPEELSTQEDLDKLIESAKKGYLNINQQPIALDFVTGQLKAAEDRASVLAEPLDKKLARLQAARTASLESSKFALERADKVLASEKATATAQAEAKTKAEQQAFENTMKEKEYALSEEKFNQDQKEFGLDYALKARETAVAEMKAKSETGTSTVQQTTASNALSNINDLINAQNLGTITSLPEWTQTGEQKVLKAKLKQLNDLLTVNARSLLKGSGAISDKETEMLKQSQSILSTWNLSDEALKAELRKISGVIRANAGENVNVEIDGEVYSSNREQIYNALIDGKSVNYL